MVDLLGNKEPLGGHINPLRCGARNAPGSCVNGCPNEYLFWGTPNDNKPKNKPENKPVNKPVNKPKNMNEVIDQPEVIENFTVGEVTGRRENFSGNTTIALIILIVVLILGLGGFLFFTRNKNRLP